jgi:hypothetical protein
LDPHQLTTGHLREDVRVDGTEGKREGSLRSFQKSASTNSCAAERKDKRVDPERRRRAARPTSYPKLHQIESSSQLDRRQKQPHVLVLREDALSR